MPRNTGRYHIMATCTEDPIKCLVVGDSGVGKTGMSIRYLGADFQTRRPEAVLDEFTVEAFVGPSVTKMTILDTACQGQYDRLRHLYYPGTDVFLVCCSTNCSDSLESARTYWVPTLRRAVPSAKIILVGTKTDIRDSAETLPEEGSGDDEAIDTFSIKTGLQVARDVSAHAYVECSSLTGSGVNDVFRTAILSVVDQVTGKRREKKVAREIGQTVSLPIQ